MNEQYNKNLNYTLKVLLISIIFALFIFLINFFVYKYVEIELPSDFILFATVFTLSSVTIYAVIAGFTILIAFTRYQDLDNTIEEEINCLGDILDFTKYLQKQENVKEKIIDNIRKYGISVANDEWLNIAKGKPNRKTSAHLERVMDSINQINLANPKNRIVFELFTNRIKDLTTFRDNRLSKAKEPFPPLLTLILYVISAVLLVSIFSVLTPNFIFQSIFLTSTAFITSLVIQAINDLGNPSKPGIWHVSKEIYENIPTSILSQVKRV